MYVANGMKLGSRRSWTCSTLMCAVAVCTSSAHGQWVESFAPYPIGATVYAGLGGWTGYPGVNDSLNVSPFDADNGRSLNASVGQAGAQHSLWNKGYGVWQFQYMMCAFMGTQGSSLGLHFSGSATPQFSLAQTPAGLFVAGSGKTIPYSYSDAWNCVRFEINLNTDTIQVYLNDKSVHSGPLPTGAVLNKVSIKAATAGQSYYDAFAFATDSQTVQRIGKKDNFVGFDVQPYLSPQLQLKKPQQWIGWRGVDEFYFDAPFGATFPFMPCTPCGPWAATLEFRCQANLEQSANNDSFSYGLTNAGVFLNGQTFSSYLGLNWAQSVGPRTFTLALSPAQIALMMQQGRFDFYHQDDSDTDYVELRTKQVCPTFGGIHSGTVGATSFSLSADERMLMPSGASGTANGVAILGQESEGVSVQIVDAFDRKSAGSVSALEAIGQIDSGDTSILSKASLTGLGDSARMKFDMSMIGATTTRLCLTNSLGQVIYSARFPTNQPEIVLIPATAGGTLSLKEAEIGSVLESRTVRWKIVPAAPIRVSIQGQLVEGVAGIFATNLTAVAWPSNLIGVSSLRVLGFGDAAISSPQIAQGDVLASAAGSAQVSALSGVLEMRGFGTATDYASLKLGRAKGWAMNLLPWVGVEDTPDGSSVKFESIGRRSSQDLQTIGSLTLGFDSGFPPCFVNANFSSIGSPTGVLEVYSGGSLVTRKTNVGLGADSGNHPLSIERTFGSTIGFVLRFPSATGFEFTGGGAAIGDELRLIASPPSNPLIEYDQDIRVSAIGGVKQVGISKVLAPREIKGKCLLEGFTYQAPRQTVSATIELFKPGSTTPIESHAVELSSSGAFSILTKALGEVELTIKTATSLRRRLVDLNVGWSGIDATNLPIVAANGDCDGDNAVTLFDYLILSAAFDTSPADPAYDVRADLDGDSVVSLFDYLLLSQNFDVQGDE